MKLIFLDACLPCYFQGYHGHVYAVPVTAESTYKTILRDLNAAISDQEIQDAKESDYDAIAESAKEIFSAANPDDVFQKLMESENDESDCVYAYFGVLP